MSVPEIEQRVTALENEVTQLKRKLEEVTNPASPWWREIYGTFADDPLHEEAIRLGREYRESLRPKPAKRTIKRSTKQSTKRKN